MGGLNFGFEGLGLGGRAITGLGLGLGFGGRAITGWGLGFGLGLEGRAITGLGFGFERYKTFQSDKATGHTRKFFSKINLTDIPFKDMIRSIN